MKKVDRGLAHWKGLMALTSGKVSVVVGGQNIQEWVMNSDISLWGGRCVPGKNKKRGVKNSTYIKGNPKGKKFKIPEDASSGQSN